MPIGVTPNDRHRTIALRVVWHRVPVESRAMCVVCGDQGCDMIAAAVPAHSMAEPRKVTAHECCLLFLGEVVGGG